MIGSLYIIQSEAGEVVMEKHWRGKGKGATLEAFWSKVLSFPRREDTPPVIKHGRHILVSILRGGLFFLAVTTGEMPSLLVVELLHRIVDVFEEYFGSASVSALTKAFSVAYQLLDEMVDHGYPLITEPNALQSLISKPSLGRRLSSFVTGSSGVKDSIDKGALSVIPWRKTGVSYINNELLMDIVEEVDAILAANGSVVKADIRGTFSVNCKLTGMPDVTLHTTAPAACADASLHPCVRIARFARDKVLSFVPPDGNFVLLRYRAPDAKLTVPVYCTPTLTWRDGVARTSFVIGTKHMSQAAGSARSSTMGSSGISSASFGFGAASSGAGVRATGGIAGGGTSSSVPVEEVVLTITFPKNYVGVDLSSEVGSITFEESTNTLVWALGTLDADRPATLEGTLHLPAGHTKAPLERPHALLHFVAPNVNATGMGVRDVSLGSSESYKFFKAARTVLRSGRFEIRC